jgi:hypothetical protein
MIRHNYQLLNADWAPYYPPSKWYCRFHYRTKPWERKWYTINGLRVRLRWFGFSFHFGAGVYGGTNVIHLGKFKAVAYRYDEYQDWLETEGLV